MSPIRKSEQARYPKDWPSIRARILDRASSACEWEGCQAAHGEYILRVIDDLDRWYSCVSIDETIDNFPVEHYKPVLVVLTVAHLNHDPSDCREENLRAWCQLHHLRYDVHHHQQNAAATRRSKKQNRELFEVCA